MTDRERLGWTTAGIVCGVLALVAVCVGAAGWNHATGKVVVLVGIALFLVGVSIIPDDPETATVTVEYEDDGADL